MTENFYIKFWGVRGSVPVANADTFRFGGNTACIEIRCGQRLLVFDAGTGIVRLGQDLADHQSCSLDLFFTHCHYDHIEGLPFFAPLHDADWNIRFWSGHLHGRQSTEEMINNYMKRPYFPVGPDCFRSKPSYTDFKPGARFDLGDGVEISTTSLNHPDGAVAYRIDYDGRSICYVTDTEHVPGKPDENIAALIKGAGIVIYDGTYNDEDFNKYIGFGHSTWQEGMRLCQAAGVEQYVVFHHRPDFTDIELLETEALLHQQWPEAHMAREGLVLRP